LPREITGLLQLELKVARRSPAARPASTAKAPKMLPNRFELTLKP